MTLLTRKTLMAALCLAVLLISPWSQAKDFQILHTFDQQNPPGNIAVSKDNRIFMSNHFFYGAKNRIVEIASDGSAKPYPSAELSQSFNPILGMIVDEKGILWLLETAKGKDQAGRLIGWDITKNALHQIVYIAAPIIPENSFLNDLAVDRENNAVYITDTAGADNSALIVVDLNTGEARRVLSGSRFTVPENIDMQIDGKVVSLGEKPARIGANPITLDYQNEWLYFAPMTGTALYRVRTQDLLNTTLSEQQLQAKVERYADKPISDGISIDSDNNIYITDITANAVGYINPQKEYVTLFKDADKLSWADGFATAPDNKLFVTVNKLHQSPVLNNNQDDSGQKYYLIAFDALGKTIIGR